MALHLLTPNRTDRDDSTTPETVHDTLRKHMLVDGFDMVLDLDGSQGMYLRDSKHDKKYLDFFSFFGSNPVGMNHPKMVGDEQFKHDLLQAALHNPSNADVYTIPMARMVETFSRVAIPEYLPYLFFVAGGALAVENAMKVAFDWKVRKNFLKGHTEERGTKIIHFRQAFHGRSGYTLSVTNTDPTKTNYYPKFDWPRIVNPKLHFPLEAEGLARTEALEQQAIAQIKQALRDFPDDIAAILLEPIQAEGGDNHFRVEFHQALRDLCDEHEMLLIYDEVQTGMGLTGKMWAHERYVRPDVLAFGKKTQVCGILCSKRIDDIEDNVFHVSSRINSTWGGNLVDMVRFRRYLEIIEQDGLVEQAARVGKHLMAGLHELATDYPAQVTNVRGEGLLCAFDLPSRKERGEVLGKGMELGILLLGCGERSIRTRPPLICTEADVDEALRLIRLTLDDVY